MVGLQQLIATFGIVVSFWHVRSFRLSDIMSGSIWEIPWHRGLRIDCGTNCVGGTGQGREDATWLLSLALQPAPAAILGVGIALVLFSPR